MWTSKGLELMSSSVIQLFAKLLDVTNYFVYYIFVIFFSGKTFVCFGCFINLLFSCLFSHLYLYSQINLLTAVMNDAPVLPDEDDEVGAVTVIWDPDLGHMGHMGHMGSWRQMARLLFIKQ